MSTKKTNVSKILKTLSTKSTLGQESELLRLTNLKKNYMHSSKIIFDKTEALASIESLNDFDYDPDLDESNLSSIFDSSAIPDTYSRLSKVFKI